jgi:hypothetical protein
MARGVQSGNALNAAKAYFRGVDLPDLASKSSIGLQFWSNLQRKQGNWGVGAARGAILGGAGLAAWSMIPRNDTLAGTAGIGAAGAAFAGLSQFPGLTGKGNNIGLGLRAAGSFFAGSMMWQGLRENVPTDYRPLA